MPDEATTNTESRGKSVFLSYASEDRAAALAIRDALASLGLTPWYDESGLGGGDVWDQKIRREIRECDFFLPVISAQTEARTEGYFRREWRFAVERTLDMADDRIFILPVVIDDTSEATARVPDRFLSVQWTRVPEGKPTPAFEAMCRRLAAGQTERLTPSQPRSAERRSVGDIPPSARVAPEFPRHEAGQSARFYGHVVVWAIQSLWFGFNRLPKWVRVVAYAWLAIVMMRACGELSIDDVRRGPNESDVENSAATPQPGSTPEPPPTNTQ